MHDEGFFYRAFVYLLAAVVSVPIAKRAGLGSVLGYLVAGMLIGPFGLAWVGEDGQDVMHFAEFGVVMMLFLVGLELEPSVLWRMRAPLLGLGGLQVLGTAVVIGGGARLAGLAQQPSIAIGLILATSSTAIALQSLAERGWMKTSGGQSAFAVLLFQDIAVIPMLAILPLLGTKPAGEATEHHHSWVDGLPGWASALVVLGAVVAVVVAGRLLVRPLLRFIAGARLREVFTAASLLLVVAIALLMSKVGLSPALGTFLAGVVLASSEYRHELESDIEPFKGLLLGLFFIAVGSSVDFSLIAQRPGSILALVAALVLLKIGVLFGLGRSFGLGTDQNLMFSLALAQGGEFCFVLFSFAVGQGVLAPGLAAHLVAVVAISMAVTPILLLLGERWLIPRVGTKPIEPRATDVEDEDKPVIIAGYGRFGQIARRLLSANGVHSTVLDVDSDQVDLLRRFGQKVFYGDASRHELLRAAGAEKARLIILAIDRPEKTLELVHTIRKHFPNLTILARAQGRTDAYDLINAGVEHVFRETFDSSLGLGVRALRLLGFRGYRAERAARAFRRHDEAAMRELARIRHHENFVNVARERVAAVEETMRADLREPATLADSAWDVEGLRAEATAPAAPQPGR